MASSKEYLHFVLVQLSSLEDITHLAMMVNTSFSIEEKSLAESITTDF